MSKKTKDGVSLVVLVMTIIVMIILAGAIVLTLDGSNIINKANDAKSKSDTSNISESAKVYVLEYEFDVRAKKIDPDEISLNDYMKDKLKEEFSEDELKNLEVLEDGTIQILPTIPTGFTVSIYNGERKISDGLVIYKTDAETLATKDQVYAQKTYDQYVWVPVDNISEFITRDGYKKGELQTLVSDKTVTEPYSTDSYTAEVEEYNKMRASVQKNGGFYIARYEAGKEDGKVVSKKEATVWNSVAWGTNMTNVGTSGAVYLSRNIYPESGTSNVVSTLCYGVQWDAVINFMKDVKNPYVEGKKYIEDSTGMGWYTSNYSTGNSTHKTGIDVDKNASNRVKNIYDMAGNMYEWTMEANSTDDRVIRGGYYDNSVSGSPSSSRYDSGPGNANYICGFRPALYIK